MQEKYLTQQELQAKKRTKMVVWTVTALVLVAAMWGIVKLSQMSTPPPSVTLADGITAEDHTMGPTDAKIELIEYGDFQCPGCASFYPRVKQLLAEYPTQVEFAYRHLPLKSIHRNAIPSAIAFEAAAKQGKKWEMMDILFTRQSEWSNLANAQEKFEQYAGELQLNVEQFRADFRSDELKDKVEALYRAAAIDKGLGSTPTFFLNGKQITNPSTYDQFKQLIEDELNKPQ